MTHDSSDGKTPFITIDYFPSLDLLMAVDAAVQRGSGRNTHTGKLVEASASPFRPERRHYYWHTSRSPVISVPYRG